MPAINYHAREITCKIVYYGPPLSGKTTNLLRIHRQIRPDHRGDLVSVDTQTDRTLFFDFLPIQVGPVAGFNTRLHLYTVPGQHHYEATRKLVLDGADGVVFVADTQAAMFSENVSSFADMHEYLAGYGRDPRTVPMVIQYNKLDLPVQLRTPTDELDRMLNFRNLPIVPAASIDGEGVFETLERVTASVFRNLETRGSGITQVA